VDKKITDTPTMHIIAEASTVVGFRVISTGPLRVKNKNLFSFKNQTRSRIIWYLSMSLLYHMGGNKPAIFRYKKDRVRFAILFCLSFWCG
jgi:hypothetical protein